jgi:His-Xaa-Ser system protein HxsD
MGEIIRKLNDNQLLLEVSKKLYNIKAITHSAYRFIDKCFIHIVPLSEEFIGVYFKAKTGSAVVLKSIVDNFCTELIDQQIRVDLEESYGSIKNAIVKQAFSSIE